jgi:hypothetical protein
VQRHAHAGHGHTHRLVEHLERCDREDAQPDAFLLEQAVQLDQPQPLPLRHALRFVDDQDEESTTALGRQLGPAFDQHVLAVEGLRAALARGCRLACSRWAWKRPTEAAPPESVWLQTT